MALRVILLQVWQFYDGTDGEAVLAGVNANANNVSLFVEVEVGSTGCASSVNVAAPVKTSRAAVAVAGIWEENHTSVLFALYLIAGLAVHGGVGPGAVVGVHEFFEFIF